jgi:hypothetical protein
LNGGGKGKGNKRKVGEGMFDEGSDESSVEEEEEKEVKEKEEEEEEEQEQEQEQEEEEEEEQLTYGPFSSIPPPSSSCSWPRSMPLVPSTGRGKSSGAVEVDIPMVAPAWSGVAEVGADGKGGGSDGRSNDGSDDGSGNSGDDSGDGGTVRRVVPLPPFLDRFFFIRSGKHLLSPLPALTHHHHRRHHHHSRYVCHRRAHYSGLSFTLSPQPHFLGHLRSHFLFLSSQGKICRPSLCSPRTTHLPLKTTSTYLTT